VYALKFVTDGMLGKLTRWLRMLGHDVKYSNRLDDGELIQIAKMENRVLLTRDLELYQQATARGVKAFYVEGREGAEKLAKLARRFNLNLEMDVEASRCPKCNTKIKVVPKEKVKGKVPEKTFVHYNMFWECPKCGQIYWQGSHWNRIEETLRKARKFFET